MTKNNSQYDDDINIFQLLETLWNSKFIIVAFILATLLFAFGFIQTRNLIYESKIIIKPDFLPPFFQGTKSYNKSYRDFKTKFHNEDIFNIWKQNNIDSLLNFKTISDTKVVDGFILSKEDDENFVKFSNSDRNNSFYITIKSNELPILNDVYLYSAHINNVLKLEYVLRAKKDLHIIETRFEDFSTANDQIISTLLDVDRFIASIEKGANILKIDRPSKPIKISPRKNFIITLSIVLGGLFGVLFVLILNAFRKYKLN